MHEQVNIMYYADTNEYYISVGNPESSDFETILIEKDKDKAFACFEELIKM
jgi:hypothetical protein